MPLDAEQEAGRGIVQRLDRPVRRGRDDLQPRAEAVDGLVVEAVDLQPAMAGQRVQRDPAATVTACAGS